MNRRNSTPGLSTHRLRVKTLILQRVHTHLRFVVSIKLSCLALRHATVALSNNRTRHVQLTARVNSNLAKILCILSRPDVNLRRHSGSHLLGALAHLHSLNGALVIIRRSRSAVHTTSRLISVNPKTNVRNNTVMTRNSLGTLVATRSSLANTCLSKQHDVPAPTRQQPNGKQTLALGGTRHGGLGDLSIRVPLNGLIYVAKISNSNGSALIGRLLCPNLRRRFNDGIPFPGSLRGLSNLGTLSGIVIVSRSPVNHAPHSGPTACANIFSIVHGLFARAVRTGTENCGTKRFSFGIGNKHYRTYNNRNIGMVRVGFLPSICIRYRIYGNTHCGHRALRIACGNGGVSSILGVATRRTLIFFRGVPRTTDHLRAVMSINLNCVHLNRATPALSNNRTRQVGLTSRLTHHSAKGALCLVSRPAAKLSFCSIRGLLSIIRHLMSGNGSILVVRRGLSMVHYTS